VFAGYSEETRLNSITVGISAFLFSTFVRTLLGEIIPQTTENDVIDQDIILLWGRKKQIITGADILGRLLRGIVKRTEFGIEKGENHV
jgi:hypothetical protein